MGLIEIDSLTRNSDPAGGETLVLTVGETELTIEVTPGNQDIRITDNDTTVKVTLDEETTIDEILQDDLYLTPEMPD